MTSRTPPSPGPPGVPSPARARLRPVRRALGARDPLVRPCDTVYAWVLLGLAVLLLAAMPVAWFAGRAAYADAVAAREDRLRTTHAVTATVVGVSSPGVSFVAPTTYAQVRWTAPDGTVRTAQAPVDRPAAPGSTTTVWIDAAGRVTQPPPPGSFATATGAATGALAAGGAVAGVFVLYLGARAAVARRRDVLWARELRAFTPPSATGRP